MESVVDEALRHLHEFAGSPELAEELTKGKEEFFKRVGAPLPGETFEESRLTSFTEWFIFDRRLPGPDRTLVEEYLRRNAETLSGERREVLVGFSRNVHSVFQVKKRGVDSALLVDLYTQSKYPGARRIPLTLGPGDMAELRLAPVAGTWFATDAVCFHPYSAKKPIEKFLKTARKKGALLEPVLTELMAMNTRYERLPKTAKGNAYAGLALAAIPRAK